MSIPIVLNNRYQLEQRLGKGGMAEVHRAYDRLLERTVAIKLLRQDYSGNQEFRERFRQEALAAANLAHPNLVTVHDFGLDAGWLFIVMEYVPGQDLKAWLQGHRPLEIVDAIQLIAQACAGIGYVHRAGLVHCDVKPQNMLVTPDNRLKVTDFGIARALASIQPDERAEIVWGSPQYFSPEQAAGEPPSPASDVYSLGVVFYEMLTGVLPFRANSADELARLHREAEPPPPSQYNPQISPQLEQIVLKVLSKEPSARYRTADQFGRILTSVSQRPAASLRDETQVATPGAARPPAMPDEQRKPVARPLPPLPSLPVEEPAGWRVRVETPTPSSEPNTNPLDIDLGTWLLALLALIAVGGLIPFWLWVFYRLNPPV